MRLSNLIDKETTIENDQFPLKKNRISQSHSLVI